MEHKSYVGSCENHSGEEMNNGCEQAEEDRPSLPILGYRSPRLLAVSSLFFPVGLLFGAGGVMAIVGLLTESRLNLIVIALASLLPCLAMALVFLPASIICWLDYFSSGPLLRLEEKRVFDYRQSRRPIEFSSIERAKISRNRRGPMGIMLWLRSGAPPFPSRMNMFRFGCGSMMSFSNERRVCISIACLDQSPWFLSEQFIQRLRRSGVVVETQPASGPLAQTAI